MKTSLIVYEIARHYLMDRRTTLEEAHISLIEGYLRSRDVSRLAGVCNLLQPMYNKAESVRTLRQISAFFKKHRDLADDDRCFDVALRSFNVCETRCKITNRRLDYYLCEQPHRLDADLRLQLIKMQAWIESVLGPFGNFLREFPELIKVTGGATSTRSRRKSLPHLKVSKRLACTPACAPYLRSLSSFFGYGDLHLRYTLWNRVEAVRKNWETHRFIACEPEGNLPCQLAFDSYGKRRLSRKGIDLHDQFRNQRLAYENSMFGRMATVDFSSASDLIAFNVVSLLISDNQWWNFLLATRSPMYVLKRPGLTEADQARPYHKFSSMGNGSTFVLETLIFAAACHAVGSKNFSVYGDDVIIETEKLPEFRRLTRFLGFRINENKTYSTGSFRESCGKDYFNGVDVTPFYLRYEDGRKPTLCHIVNSCAPLAEYGALWSFLRRLIVDKKLPFAPLSLNTMSGVWVDPKTAYSLGLIKNKGWVPRFRGYVTSRHTTKVWDTRALFLWYLSNQRAEPHLKTMKFSFLSGSFVPTSTEKYSRRWVVWNPTHGGTQQLYLYGWSDYITAK